MENKIIFNNTCQDNQIQRIGGGALIGNSHEWPIAPDGTPLTLIASLPALFINENTSIKIPEGFFISIFSYYLQDEYFLDVITYHGSPEELKLLQSGFSRVILHKPQEEKFGPITIPAMRIDLAENSSSSDIHFNESKVGGAPNFLQQEQLDLEDQCFVLQIYGGSFPKPYNGIFGLSDAIGYLFITPNKIPTVEPIDFGTFFVQVT